MNINVKNLNDHGVVIDIEGVIGVDERLQFEDAANREKVSTYEKLSAILDDVKASEISTLRLNIRSMGGSVQDALLIYSALCELPAEITIETHCYGFCASAATIIAQAASTGMRHISTSALYMIHNSSAEFEGNATDASSMAELLAKTDQQIAKIYATRSGIEAEHFAEIMGRGGGKGEWLSAEEAVEMGLADKVENHSSIKNLANTIKDFIVGLFPSLAGRDEASTQSTTESGLIIAEQEELFVAMELEPTKTQRIEDPAIARYGVKTTHTNNHSYDQDAELFAGR